MNKVGKIVIVIILVAVVITVIVLKQKRPSPSASEPLNQGPGTATSTLFDKPQSAGLPRLVDLGAKKCIPCKMMAPILEELKKEYTGRLEVEFIDVWKKPEMGKRYGIRLIPTQIFFDASGKELFRHEGFFSREDILAKWKELGVELEKTK